MPLGPGGGGGRERQVRLLAPGRASTVSQRPAATPGLPVSLGRHTGREAREEGRLRGTGAGRGSEPGGSLPRRETARAQSPRGRQARTPTLERSIHSVAMNLQCDAFRALEGDPQYSPWTTYLTKARCDTGTEPLPVQCAPRGGSGCWDRRCARPGLLCPQFRAQRGHPPARPMRLPV